MHMLLTIEKEFSASLCVSFFYKKLDASASFSKVDCHSKVFP